MHLRDGGEGFLSSVGRDAAGRILDGSIHPPRQGDPESLAGGVQPVDEFFPGQDRCGGDGKVRFRLGPLVELDGLAFFHQGAFQHTDVGEFVREGPGAVRAEFAEVFDDAGVAPGEQAVEVANLGEEGVVAFGADGHDALRRAGAPDAFGQVADAFVGRDALAVGDAEVLKVPGDLAVHIDAGDDEGAEEVALAAFIDAEMRFIHLRVEHFLVAELGLAENVGFETELDKFLRAFALDHRLGAFFVNRDGQFVLLGEIERVGARFKFITLRAQEFAQLRGLLRGERRIVQGDGFFRHRFLH
jgi:hypothetical protein